jgi:hypothetical protein
MTNSQYRTTEEQIEILNVCKSCDKFNIDQTNITTCISCNCSLSLLITFTDQICPEGKW